MSKDQLERLKNRVFAKKESKKETELTGILELAREFSCLPDILGRDYDILDSSGKLVYTIRQKPMAIKQLNTLLKEMEIIKKRDNEREAAKFGSKKGIPKKLARR